MAQSMAEALIEQGKAQGIEQGKAQGIEQGKAQGIEQESRASAIRHILAVLKMKFSPDIVNALTPALREINEVERLEQLLLTAVEVQSLEAFAQMLQE